LFILSCDKDLAKLEDKTISISLNSPLDSSVVNDSLAILKWQSKNATSFDVHLDTINPPEKTISESINTDSLKYDNISPGQSYYWKVIAKSGKRSAKSKVSLFASSPIVLEHWLNLGDIKPQWSLFIVFFNIINVITGYPERLRATHYVGHGFFETAPDRFSNAGTMFGVSYLVAGYFFSLYMSSIISSVSYILYFRRLMTKNPIVKYLLLIFLIFGILSFYTIFYFVVSL